LSVEISAGEVASVVADDYAIDVEHWDDLEDEALT
jgi:hypothetical protein